MDDGTIRLEWHDSVALMILDRPDRHNAFNQTMWSALEHTVDLLSEKLPRAVVITGSGDRSFCAGMDVNPDNPQITELADALTRGDREPADALIRRIRGAVDRLYDLGVPLIAAVNGNAYGGGAELACRCDIRVMDPGALICFSEVRLGLMPDWGGAVGLTRLVGPGHAADMVLTGRKVGADEAFRLGLANRLSEPGLALNQALEMAAAIAANGPQAVRHALSPYSPSSGPGTTKPPLNWKPKRPSI
jgi:enoyl-CoA hydratase